MHRKKWYGFVTVLGILLVLALSQSVATSSQAPLPGMPNPVGAPAAGTAVPAPTARAAAVPTLEPAAQAIAAATRVAAFATARAATPTVIPALGPSETAWRTFTHAVLPFSFQYPPYLYLSSNALPNSSTMLTSVRPSSEKRRFDGPPNSAIQIIISSHQMVGSTLLDHVNAQKSDLSEPQPTVVSSEMLTVAAKPALQQVLYYKLRTGEEFTAVDTYIQYRPDMILAIGASPSTSIHMDDFYKMLSTIQFR